MRRGCQMAEKFCKGYALSFVLMVTFAAAAVALTLKNAQSTAYPYEMVAYWKFDDAVGTTAFDSSGRNHGTIFGASWVAGVSGGALSFDGENDYVHMGKNHAWDFGRSDFSISFWIKPDGDSLSRNGHDSVLVIGRQAGNIELWITYGGRFPSESGNRLWLSTDYADAKWQGFNADSGIGVSNLWHFVTVTKCGDKWKMYIDGVKKIDQTYSFHPSSGSLKIGRHIVPGRYFNGIMDEVAIYKRALDAEEIQHHYINGLNGLGYTGMI